MSQAHAVKSSVLPKPVSDLQTGKDGSPLIEAVIESDTCDPLLHKALMKIRVLPWLVTLKDITFLSRSKLFRIQDVNDKMVRSIVSLLDSYNLKLRTHPDKNQWLQIGRSPVPREFVQTLTLDRLLPELNRYLRHKPHWVHGLLLLSVNERDIEDLERVNIKCIQDVYVSTIEDVIQEYFPQTLVRTYWADTAMVVRDRLIAIVKAFIGLLADAGISGSQFA